MPEEREAKVRRLIQEVYGNGNVEAMDELYDPQVIRHNPPYPVTNDLATYKETTKGIIRAWSDVQFKLHELIFAEDTTTIRYTWEATHSGETPQSHIPATGKRIMQDGCVVAHWRGNKIVEEWLYADYVGLFQQLGVIPALTGVAG